MQFVIPAIFSILLVSGIRSEAEPLAGSTLYKEGHHDYLQSFHHGGQHHPSVGGSGSDVGGTGGSNVGVGHPVDVNRGIQDQNTAVSQDQIVHPSVGQVGGHPGQGQIPVVHPGISPYVQKAEIPHYFGRAIGSPYPYLYGKTYASPYYAPYQSASPYSGYYPPAYPYHYSASPYSASPYSASPYSAVTPYSSPVYSGPVGYSGYTGYSGPSGYGYVPQQYYPGYTPYYPQSSEVQQSPSKQ